MTKLMTLLAISTSLTACLRNKGDDDLAGAELASDSTSMSDSEASLLASTVDGSNTAGALPATPEGVAGFIASHAPQRYSPAGCAVATQNGASVSIAFTSCVGPRGLREVNGTLSLVASAGDAGAVDIAASATGMQIGRSTMDVDATATYTVANGAATLAVVTHSSGTGPLGNAIVHDGDYTATWTDSCVAVDGQWSTEVGEAGRSTTASLMRCLDQCPTGSITRDTFRNRTITITFDGSDTAQWATSAGRNGTFQLPCGL